MLYLILSIFIIHVSKMKSRTVFDSYHDFPLFQAFFLPDFAKGATSTNPKLSSCPFACGGAALLMSRCRAMCLSA